MSSTPPVAPAAGPGSPAAPRDGQPLSAGLGHLVHLDLGRDHPGFRDLAYRSRRDAITAAARAYHEGDPLPEVSYTDEEHGVWRTVWRELEDVHAALACHEYLRLKDVLALPRDRIPQLREVNALLAPLGGVRMLPVAGLVSARSFLSYMARKVFLSTQYIRHPSRPLYTPEPDVVHELVGHAIMLADEPLIRLNVAFGQRALRAEDDRTMDRVARLYWYTLEFGALEDGENVRAYGSGLLSSCGELGRFSTHAELRRFDPDEMMERPYDPTDYQAVIYVAKDLSEVSSRLVALLDRL